MSSTERIFELLSARGITAADAATATGISKGNFTEWKKGRNGPGFGALVKLATFLNVSVDYLECKTDDPDIDNKKPAVLSNDGLTEEDIRIALKVARLSKMGKVDMETYLDFRLSTDHRDNP